MPQLQSPRGYDYGMPPALVSCLVRGTTWDLFCPACGRHARPDIIDLLDRFGDRFTDAILYRRSVCRSCGERMKIAGGYFVKWQQASGELHTMVMPARVDRPAF